MMTFLDWCTRWHVPAAAIKEWNDLMGMDTTEVPMAGKSEAAVQNFVRIESSKLGWRLFRNNVGVLKDERGRPVRYGLANESKQMNDVLKSSDLIGARPVLIGPQHVGHIIGQFVGREAKHGDWVPGEDVERETAQSNFATVMNSIGADVKFTTGKL